MAANNTNDGPLKDFIHLSNPSNDVAGAAKTRYLVFMITGNPGLIEYYRDFFNYLNKDLQRSFGNDQEDAQASNVEFELYGRSMGGFELDDAAHGKKDVAISGYHDLKQQIDIIENTLLERVVQIKKETNGQKLKVILMGHSVGSYILLELVQRHRQRLEVVIENKTAHEKDGEVINGKVFDSKLPPNEPDIVSGICLFPTIVDIGKSPQGQILSSLSRIPLFPSLVSLIALGLTIFTPTTIINSLIGAITGMRNHPAAVTAAFISSRSGVQQALYMGADEMRTITADKWDSEIWGAAHSSPCAVPRPRLFFYFGRKDHWVADHTRDELIALRGRCAGDTDDWRPWMEIDELGVPHGFCINHSVEIAKKCAHFIETVVTSDQKDDEKGR